jgi:hypothetical protein
MSLVDKKENDISYLGENIKNQAKKIILKGFDLKVEKKPIEGEKDIDYLFDELNKALPPPVEGEIRSYKDGDYKFISGHWKKLALLLAEEAKQKVKKPIPEEPVFDPRAILPKKEPKTEKTFLSHIIFSSLKEGGRIRDFAFIDEDNNQIEFLSIDRKNQNKLIYRKTKMEDIKVEKFPPKSQDYEHVIIGKTEQDLTKFFESHPAYYKMVFDRIRNLYKNWVKDKKENFILNPLNITNSLLYKFGTKDAERFLDYESFDKDLVLEEDFNVISELNKASIPIEGEIREYKDGVYKFVDGHWKKQINQNSIVTKPKEGEIREYKDGKYKFENGNWKKLLVPLPKPTMENFLKKYENNEPIEYEGEEYWIKKITNSELIISKSPIPGDIKENKAIHGNISELLTKDYFNKDFKLKKPETLKHQDIIYKQGEKVSYLDFGVEKKGWIKGFTSPDNVFVWNDKNHALLKIGTNKIKKIS